MTDDDQNRPLRSEEFRHDLEPLPPSAELVYRVLVELEPATTREIKEETCRTMRTVDEALRRLHDEGIIERTPISNGGFRYLWRRRED